MVFEMIYILIAIGLLLVECTEQVDTDYIFDKIAHGTLFLGCVIAYSTHDNMLFIVGLILTLITIFKTAYKREKDETIP